MKGFDKLVLDEVLEPQAGVHEVVAWARARGFCATDYKAIITHRFHLCDIHKAVEVMARRDRNKVIVNP